MSDDDKSSLVVVVVVEVLRGDGGSIDEGPRPSLICKHLQASGHTRDWTTTPIARKSGSMPGLRTTRAKQRRLLKLIVDGWPVGGTCHRIYSESSVL